MKDIDLLLVGGGHAHVLFLRMWAMKPLPRVRVTIVSPQSQTAYSGMLPGVLSGVYSEDEAHIDLVRLCAWAGARFIRDAVSRVDAKKKSVILKESGLLEFDYLSINTGITPEMHTGFSSKVVGVKPTDKFLEVFQNVLHSCLNPNSFMTNSKHSSLDKCSLARDISTPMDSQGGWGLGEGDRVLSPEQASVFSDSSKPLKIAVVGGGASGIEVALNLAIRLTSGQNVWPRSNKSLKLKNSIDADQQKSNSGANATKPESSQKSGDIFATHKPSNDRVRRSFKTAEADPQQSQHFLTSTNANIAVNDSSPKGRPRKIVLIHSGSEIGPSYTEKVRGLLRRELHRLGVELMLNKRIDREIDGTLISGEWQESFDHIFWATRAQAPSWIKDSGLLTDSLGFLKVSRTLQSLSHSFVFGAGDVVAVEGFSLAKSGVYAVRAAPVLFANVKELLSAEASGKAPQFHHWAPQSKFLSIIGIAGSTAIAGRGHFAAQGRFWWWLKDKIDRRFMAQFEPPENAATMISQSSEMSEPMVCKGCAAKVAPGTMASFLSRPLAQGVGEEDASAMVFGNTRIMASIDRLTDIVSDPYCFGKIAVNHAMSDLYATLSSGRYFLASVELSKNEKAFQLRDLRRLMAGISAQAKLLGAELVSAHTSEGEGLAVSLAVIGSPNREKVKKRGGRINDLVVMTKPLGTGIVFASITQHKGIAQAYDEALDSMLLSNRDFSEIFSQAGVDAVTDVTGFGLAGHLLELLSEDLTAKLSFSKIPHFRGVDKLLKQGVKSSAHEANWQFSPYVASFVDLPESALLYDPQTSGGLMAFMSQSQFEHVRNIAVNKGLSGPWLIGSLEARAEKKIVIDP